MRRKYEFGVSILNLNLASSIKNEGPFLLEWIAHHRVVGFDHILIGFNDCTDGSDDLLRLLAFHGEIEILENTVQDGQNPQREFYSKLRKTNFFKNADWLCLIDSDEFVNIHYGDGSIAQLVEKYSDVDFIAFCWKIFGGSDHESWNNEFVTNRFTSCVVGQKQDNQTVKCVIREPKRFKVMTNHYAKKQKTPGVITYSNAEGKKFNFDEREADLTMDVLGKFTKGKASHRDFQLNHYATKTLDSFYLRRLRGRGFRAKGKAEHVRHHFRAFMRYNLQAKETDTSINRYKNAREAEFKRLLNLPDVKVVHNQIIHEYGRNCKKAQNIINACIESGEDLQELFLNPIW